MSVLDASALLAFLQGEPGADRVEKLLVEGAEWAAARWRPGEGVSLADRLCLALSARLGDPAVTADTAWGTDEGSEQLR